MLLFALKISGPPVPRCGFCGVEAEGKGRKGKRKERKEREKNGKRTSQRAFFGGCVLLLVGFWVRRGARDVKKKKKNRSVARGERVVPVSEEVVWVYSLFVPPCLCLFFVSA